MCETDAASWREREKKTREKEKENPTQRNNWRVVRLSGNGTGTKATLGHSSDGVGTRPEWFFGGRDRSDGQSGTVMGGGGGREREVCQATRRIEWMIEKRKSQKN